MAATLSRGDRLIRQCRYQEAVDEFTECIQQDSKDRRSAALLGRALAFKHLKDEKHALADLSDALAIDRDDADAYHLRARIFSKMEEHDRAIADLTRVISLRPSSGEAHQLRGVCHGKCGDYSSALSDLSTAIALSPNDAELYRTRGLAYGHLRRYEEALRDLDRALLLEPENVSARRDRGCIYVHIREHDLALADLSAAIASAPNDIQAFHNRALVYYRLGRFERSIADSLRVLDATPNDGDANLDTGKAYLRLGKSSKAIGFLVNAVRHKPSHAPTVTALLQKLLDKADAARSASKEQKAEYKRRPRTAQMNRDKRRSSSAGDLRSLAANINLFEQSENHGDEEIVEDLSDMRKDNTDTATETQGDAFIGDYLSRKDVDNARLSDDSRTDKKLTEKQRKGMLKQMLASQRLKEFRARRHRTEDDPSKEQSFSHDKATPSEATPVPSQGSSSMDNRANATEIDPEEVSKKVRARKAVTAIEVERRAEQAVRLKRDLSQRFQSQRLRELELKELVDDEVKRWHDKAAVRSLSALGEFMALVSALPDLLPWVKSLQSTDKKQLLSAKKVFRLISFELHPDKVDPTLPLQQRLLARSAWCCISEAYARADSKTP